METNSSGEELVVKQARKPYTITKQREKWTEEEHNKFIEALKLYGRAWQRIEEHIGTKTAVQIRSHAQKFFTKLEKEAVMKGVPFGQAHDIEIPPPRPKRKPSSPYPRKTGAGSLSPSAEATDEKTSKSQFLLSNCKQSINSDDCEAWKVQEAKDNSEDGSSLEVLDLFQDARVASNSSLSKGPNRFGPLEKEMRDRATLKDSSLSIELNGDMKGNCTFNANIGNKELKGAEALKQKDKTGQSDQSCAKDAPIDFMKSSGDENINARPSLNPTIPSTSEANANSGVSSIHHPFQTFPPFSQFPTDQDDYQSFLNVSSTFSSLIISTLLQNPAVHAAASVAASFWPSVGLDASTTSSSESVRGGMLNRHLNPNPRMAAIAAATVAAASAWWATQGLLPMYSPLHPGFAFAPAPAPATAIPIVSTAPAPDKKEERSNHALKNSVAIDDQVVDPEQSEAARASSSSDSGESGRAELTDSKSNKFGVDTEQARNTKKLDRSSCGSNTPSSSEVETDAVLKQDGDEIELKEAHLNVNPLLVETNTRRIRSGTGIMSESWKEVSEEGRIAFQALFNREVLPQSFSPPHAKDSILTAVKDKEGTSELQVDLNMKASSEPGDIYHVQASDDPSSRNPFSSESSHGKQRVRRMGFKPYKRCSVEAKEGRATVGDETGNKRIRLEGGTSILGSGMYN